ncbi:MAG: hypothetical protein WAP52_01070 [Candidatus Sungiibacteriota bacterium]
MNYIATIPQKISKQGELVILSRKQYDSLVRAAHLQIRPAPVKVLNVELREAMQEVKQGKAVGPFENAIDLMRSLRSSQIRH